MKIANFILLWLWEILGVFGAIVMFSGITIFSHILGLILLCITGISLYKRLN